MRAQRACVERASSTLGRVGVTVGVAFVCAAMLVTPRASQAQSSFKTITGRDHHQGGDA